MAGAMRRHRLTRRQFLKGSAAAAASIAVASVLPGCTNSSDSSGDDKPTTVSESDATSILDAYEEADLALTQTASWSLSAGSVLHPGGDTWLPVLARGTTANPMVVAQALSLVSGSVTDVVSKPLGEESDCVIYDVSCSDDVYAWVEMNALDRSWKLYAQPFSAGLLSGSPTELWEADSDYDPPYLCCRGSKVYWLVMPSTSGSKTTEHSFCYLWKKGSSDASAVVESPGRFACEPTISGDVITLVPRVNADEGVYYGITAYSLDDDLETTIDRLVLPTSIRPFKACRIGDEFVFSIEASYDYGGLFGNMGTYIGHGDSGYITLSREPAADVAGTTAGVYVIKSRSSYFVVDVENETYAVLEATNNCVDYGEYPASVGETSTFVTFATVKDATTGSPASVAVRAFGL
jgi:hypothetical protein